MVRIHGLAQGGNPVVAPEREWRIDVQALIDSATEKSRLCVIANPNNPTGTYITGQELRRLRSGLPPDCLLVIDGAYAEYVDRKDYDSGASLVDAGGNTVMTRTFSKIHGLASLRIGWAYCPAVRGGIRCSASARRSTPTARPGWPLPRRSATPATSSGHGGITPPGSCASPMPPPPWA